MQKVDLYVLSRWREREEKPFSLSLSVTSSFLSLFRIVISSTEDVGEQGGSDSKSSKTKKHLNTSLTGGKEATNAHV